MGFLKVPLSSIKSQRSDGPDDRRLVCKATVHGMTGW